MSNLDCAICHESNLEEVGELDTCDHCFCVRCILEWSKISNTCPLCKQRFWAIYQKRLDVSRLASNSDNVAEKFPGEVVATHIVMQRDPKPAEGEEFQDPLDDILCMECGGAQDEDLTLLCEGCNQGCHTYCADPPIEDISLLEDWYCSACAPTLAPNINRQRQRRTTRPSTLQAGALPNAAARSRSDRRTARNRIRQQSLHHGGASSSEPSDPEDEDDADREAVISDAANLIASDVGGSRSGGRRIRGRRRSVPRTGSSSIQRIRQLPPSENAETHSHEGPQSRTPRELSERLPSRATMNNIGVVSRARRQVSRDNIAYSQLRNVEALRQNWEALRREDMSFGEGSGHRQESSSDEDNLSLADHARLMQAKRFLKDREHRQGRSQNSRTAARGSKSVNHETLPALMSFSAQCRAELAEASARSRLMGHTRGSNSTPTSRNPLISQHGSQRKAPARSHCSGRVNAPEVSRKGRQASEESGAQRDGKGSGRSSKRPRLDVHQPVTSPGFQPHKPEGQKSAWTPPVLGAHKDLPKIDEPPSISPLPASSQRASLMGKGFSRPVGPESYSADGAADLPTEGSRGPAGGTDHLVPTEAPAEAQQSQDSTPQQIATQMQPQPQTDLTEQPLSAQKHETLGPGVAARPSRSEDSSISCKGLFEAGDGEEGASRDLLATAPGALRPESSSAGNEFGDQEGGLQALKERKDAAARDVKLHIDRWYREKKITTAEFKAVARRATHELYKGMAVVGSKEWIDQEGQIVRSTLRDLRASKVQ